MFRFETAPANVAPGQDYQISDYDLASRLSFFLWGSIPDDELLTLAQQHKLSEREGARRRRCKRMLADPRSEALSTRFAAQWLRLQDLDKVRPDAFWFPDYDQQLADDMRRETELFFNDIVRNDRSILDLFTADYTFVNERLARHYGIPNVSGQEFRRVKYPDSTRRGILGQGSMLVQTSLANRTSPVLRGKWVMEVLIGHAATAAAAERADARRDGRRQGRPAAHDARAHGDPPQESDVQHVPPVHGSDRSLARQLRRDRQVAVSRERRCCSTRAARCTTARRSRRRPTSRRRCSSGRFRWCASFTENLMAYALGRRVEDYDQPTVRAIAQAGRRRTATDSRRSCMGVVNSSAFRSKRAEAASRPTQDKQ